MNKTKSLVGMLSVCALLAVLFATLAGCNGGGSAGSGGAAGTSPGGGAASTGSTVKTIQNRITADKELQGASITVKEQTGTILLDGTVSNPAQKDRAEAVVYAAQKELKQQPGVLNNLLIAEGKPGAGAKDNKDNGGH